MYKVISLLLGGGGGLFWSHVILNTEADGHEDLGSYDAKKQKYIFTKHAGRLVMQNQRDRYSFAQQADAEAFAAALNLGSQQLKGDQS